MRTRDVLLRSIGEYIAENGISEREFGVKVTGDHKWLPRLRAGQASLYSIERAEAIIAGRDISPPRKRSGSRLPEARP